MSTRVTFKLVLWTLLSVLKPTWKKAGLTILLMAIAIGAVHLVVSEIARCMFSWGCDGDVISFRMLATHILGPIFFLPVYLFLQLLWSGFGKVDILSSEQVAIAFLILLEVLYLYLLVCLGSYAWSMRRKLVIFSDKKSAFFKIILWIPFVIILLFDLNEVPYRITYIQDVLQGQSLWFDDFSVFWRFVILALLEAWYLWFLVKNRSRIFLSPWIFPLVWSIAFFLFLLSAASLLLGFTV